MDPWNSPPAPVGSARGGGDGQVCETGAVTAQDLSSLARTELDQDGEF